MRIKTNTMQYRDPNTGEFVSIPIVVSEPKEEKFELIESFEVTEELASFIRTTEPDGTPYDFQKIKVIVKQVKGEKTGTGGIKCIDNSQSFYITSSSETFNTRNTYAQYNGYIKNGVLKGECSSIIATTGSPDDLNECLNHNIYRACLITESLLSVCETVKLDKIEYLVYQSLNGYPITVGTKIDIYAVRS